MNYVRYQYYKNGMPVERWVVVRELKIACLIKKYDKIEPWTQIKSVDVNEQSFNYAMDVIRSGKAVVLPNGTKLYRKKITTQN